LPDLCSAPDARHTYPSVLAFLPLFAPAGGGNRRAAISFNFEHVPDAEKHQKQKRSADYALRGDEKLNEKQ
jgi:hypothetical protein